MKKFALLVIPFLLFFQQPSFAFWGKENPTAPTSNCQTLSCVRKEIDVIDKQIVELIGKRLAYVKMAGELKKNRKIIHDCAREHEILQQAKEQAESLGYPSDIAVEVFKTILVQSNSYERKYHTFRN